MIEEIETRFSDAAFVIRVKTFNAIMSSVHSVCLNSKCVCLSVYVCVCGEKNYKNNACNRKSELCNMIS